MNFRLAETSYCEELRTSPCFSVSNKSADEPHNDDMIIISKKVGWTSLLAIVAHRHNLAVNLWKILKGINIISDLMLR